MFIPAGRKLYHGLNSVRSTDVIASFSERHRSVRMPDRQTRVPRRQGHHHGFNVQDLKDPRAARRRGRRSRCAQMLLSCYSADPGWQSLTTRNMIRRMSSPHAPSTSSLTQPAKRCSSCPSWFLPPAALYLSPRPPPPQPSRRPASCNDPITLESPCLGAFS